MRLHIKKEIGHLKLTRLSPAQVQSLLNRKQATGLSARTVQYIHAVLRRALNVALRWGLVSRNAAALVDAPPLPFREQQAFSAENAKDFLVAVKGKRLESLYVTTLALGLRIGEALALQWSDVDLDAATLSVRHNLQRIKGEGLVLAEPKSARSRRRVALPPFVVESLQEHHRRQAAERLKAGAEWQGGDFVFATVYGGPIDRGRVYRQLKVILEKAKLPDINLHELRHSCVSLLLAQKVPMRIIMETVGHSQIGVTMNLYAHVLPEVQAEAADAMENALGGGSK